MAEEIVEQAPQTGGGKKKLIIIIAASTLIIIAAAVGVSMALSGGDENTEAGAQDEPKQPEFIYVDINPEFVINLVDNNNRPKFLKAEMSVATTDPDVEEAVALHMPAIRNSLVLLLSRQVYDNLIPHEGKEQLRAQALAEVQAVLEARIGSSGVDELYFSNFVMH